MATNPAALAQCEDCERIWDLNELHPLTDDDRQTLELDEPQDLTDPHVLTDNEPDPPGRCPECHGWGYKYTDDYVSGCPRGPHGIRLVGFVGSCSIPVRPTGWAYDDGPLDSSDEVFACQEGCGSIPSEWVFHRLSRKKADRQMTTRSARHSRRRHR